MDGLVPIFWAKLPKQSKVNDLGAILSNFCAKLPKLLKWTHRPNICVEIGTPASSTSNHLGLPRLALEPTAASKV